MTARRCCRRISRRLYERSHRQLGRNRSCRVRVDDECRVGDIHYRLCRAACAGTGSTVVVLATSLGSRRCGSSCLASTPTTAIGRIVWRVAAVGRVRVARSYHCIHGRLCLPAGIRWRVRDLGRRARRRWRFAPFIRECAVVDNRDDHDGRLWRLVSSDSDGPLRRDAVGSVASL